MRGRTIILSPDTRQQALEAVAAAPDGVAVNLSLPSRSNEQNAKMWAMIADIVQACPDGRKWTGEAWKCAFMHALGHEVQFAEGLDNSGPFPIGFRSSKLTKSQMADLITVIIQYGDKHGVAWSDPRMVAQEAAFLELQR